MPADPKTLEKYRALVAKLGKLAPDCKAVDARLWPLINALMDAARDVDAVGGRDGATIQLQMKAVAAETLKVRAALRAVEDALADLAEIEKDDEFVVAENRKLALLAKELNRQRGNQTLNLDNANRALEEGKAALQQAGRSREAATRALATLEELAGKFRDAVLARGKVVDLRLDAAARAARERDREGFKKAFGEAGSQARTLRDDARKFLAAHAGRVARLVADFGRPIVTEPMGRSAAKAAAAIEAEAMRVELAVDRLSASAPPPIDAAKAAKLLGLDKQIDKVRRALDGARDDIADQLHQLGRDFGLGRSGRQLVEDLRKARIL